MKELTFIGENTSFTINCIDSWSFELGECYLDDKVIVYLLDPEFSKYYKNMIDILSKIEYEDEIMQMTFSETIPHIFKQFKTINKEHCIVIKKLSTFYPLRNILNYFENELDGKHIAWIISRLLNIVKFLNYNNIVHNGITLDNCFIEPESHTLSLYGGWWYSKENDEQMTGTNSDIYNLLLPITKEYKKSTIITDINSVKYIGKQLCGFTTYGFTTLPDNMLDFLNSSSNDNVFEQMNKWDLSKEKSYGKPKFIDFKIEKNNIYNMKGEQ